MNYYSFIIIKNSAQIKNTGYFRIIRVYFDMFAGKVSNISVKLCIVFLA